MYVDFCIARTPKQSRTVLLDNIFYLCADKTYHVNHTSYDDGRYILVYTLSGNGCLRIRNRRFTLTAGDVLVFKPTELFEYFCAEASWNFWWFEFHSDACQLNLDHKYNTPLDSLMLSLCNTCFLCLKQGNEQAASGLFGAFFNLLEIKLSDIHMGEFLFHRFQQADHFIRDNIAEVTVGSIAQHLAVNERTLRNIFHRCAQCSPKEYTDTIKLDNARYLLKSTSKTIDEISSILGYCNQFHFSTAFKKRFGVAPSKYRNLCE